MTLFFNWILPLRALIKGDYIYKSINNYIYYAENKTVFLI